jgi:hypothetical protein
MITTPSASIERDALGYSVLSAHDWVARAGLQRHVGVLAVLLASEAESWVTAS